MPARNLIDALAQLPAEERLLVWCGNNHYTKVRVPSLAGEPDSSWGLMGYHFREQSGLDPFVIEQGRTVLLPGMSRRPLERWLEEIAPTLLSMGGTAGFLSNEAPSCLKVAPGNDAEVISLDNELEEWITASIQKPVVRFFQKHEGDGLFGSKTTGRACHHRNRASSRCSSRLRCVNQKEFLELRSFILF